MNLGQLGVVVRPRRVEFQEPEGDLLPHRALCSGALVVSEPVPVGMLVQPWGLPVGEQLSRISGVTRIIYGRWVIPVRLDRGVSVAVREESMLMEVLHKRAGVDVAVERSRGGMHVLDQVEEVVRLVVTAFQQVENGCLTSVLQGNVMSVSPFLVHVNFWEALVRSVVMRDAAQRVFPMDVNPGALLEYVGRMKLRVLFERARLLGLG